MNDKTPTQTFNDLLPACCADLREYTQTLYHSYGGASLGIEADDLFNDVIAKLAERNYPVKSRGYLFGLVKQVTIHWMSDLRRKRNFREKFISLPPPTWESSLGEDWIETLPTMAASPCEQVDLSDIIQEIGKAAEEDPKIALLFKTLCEFVEQGEETSVVNLSKHLHLPSKQVTKSLGKLRSVARAVLVCAV